MGYSLTIGEAKIYYDDEQVYVSADTVSLPDAPAYGEPTDKESQRWPSYSTWADAMRTLGLVDVMFGHCNGGAGEFVHEGQYGYPLIPSHPGAAPITKLHVGFIEAAMSKYKALHPTHIARFPPPKPDAVPIAPGLYRDEDCDQNPIYDGHLCRGEWLLFWCRWAVENCTRPVFVNR